MIKNNTGQVKPVFAFNMLKLTGGLNDLGQIDVIQKN